MNSVVTGTLSMQQLLGLLTLVIAGFIFISFIMFFLKDRGLNKQYRSMLSRIEGIGRTMKGKVSDIDFSVLPNKESEVANQLFIFKSTETGIRLSTKNNKAVLRLPLEQSIPASPASPYRFVPAMLTTIGILGTFAGISLGLVGLDYGAGQSSGELLIAAKELLSGMKTAFITSLFGMLAALGFMLQLGLGAIGNDRQRDKAFAALTSVSTYTTANELLHGMSTEGQQQLVELQLSATKQSIESQQSMQDAISSLSENIKGLNAENMAKAVGDSVALATRHELKPTLASITDELKVLHEIKRENSREIMEVILEAMKKDIVAPMSEQISKVVESVDNSNQVTQDLSRSMEDVTTRLSSTTEVLSHFQKETMQKLQDFAGSLSNILGDFQSNAANVLERIAQEIEQSMSAAKEGMALQRKAFEESAEKAANAFADQNQQLATVGEQAKQLMDSARENLTDGLADVDSKIKSMSDVVQQELENFRTEYQQNLETFFVSQSNLLEQALGEQRDGLSQVVSDFREVFVDEQKERLKQRAELADGERVLRELNEATQSTRAATLSQLDELATTVGKQVGLLRKSYEEASGRYAAMTEAMPKAMGEWFDKAKDSQDSYFASFDEASANVHRNLADVAELLLASAAASQQVANIERTEYLSEV